MKTTLPIMLALVALCRLASAMDVLGTAGLDRMPDDRVDATRDSLHVTYQFGSPVSFHTGSDTVQHFCRTMLVGPFLGEFRDAFAPERGEAAMLYRAQREYVVGSLLFGFPAAVLIAVGVVDVFDKPLWQLEPYGIACLAVALPLITVDIALGARGNRHFRVAIEKRRDRIAQLMQQHQSPAQP
jgi:hypothetical protein